MINRSAFSGMNVLFFFSLLHTHTTQKRGTHHNFSREFLHSPQLLSWLRFLSTFSAKLSALTQTRPLFLHAFDLSWCPLFPFFSGFSLMKLSQCKNNTRKDFLLSSPLLSLMSFPARECPSCNSPPLSNRPAVPRTPIPLRSPPLLL